MSTFKKLINEVFENLKENNIFSTIKVDDSDGSVKVDSTPRRHKKSVAAIKNDKVVTEPSIKEKIASLAPAAAGHLIGLCFKFFNSKDFNFNFNKIHLTLRNDMIDVTNLTERVNGSRMPQKDIIVTREDVDEVLQIQDPSKVIKMIRSGGITSKDSAKKSSYRFMTSEIKDASYPVDSEMVATRGTKKEVYDNNEINQLNLKVTHGSQRSGSNTKEEKRQYSKARQNDYVINSSAKLCVKIKGLNAYIFVIPVAERSNVTRARRMRTSIESSDADKWAGIVIYGDEVKYDTDLFATPSFLHMLADSLSNPRLKS